MRPILLKGHSRSITMVKYNREGDLLVSCSKDNAPNLWYSQTGERIGTYEGHTGSLWACDISYHSTYLLTASADSTVKLWDVSTGKCLFTFRHTGPVRSVQFSLGDRYFVSVCDKFVDHPATISVYALPNDINQCKYTVVYGWNVY